MSDLAPIHRSAKDQLCGLLPLLVIDDDAVQRRLIMRAAEKCSYVVTEAESCKIGLEMLRSRPFVAVTLDLNLIDGDGIGILQGMAALRFEGAVFVISGSGSAHRTMARRSANQVGIVVSHSFPKPIDLAALRIAFAHLRCRIAGLPMSQSWGEAIAYDGERSER